MQTMFVDFRPGLANLSVDELSLSDDEVDNHQIEVGRLAQGMREAAEESIGRLNVIIAQLHGYGVARERENPFRPYLLARALYEGKAAALENLLLRRLLPAHSFLPPGSDKTQAREELVNSFQFVLQVKSEAMPDTQI